MFSQLEVRRLKTKWNCVVKKEERQKKVINHWARVWAEKARELKTEMKNQNVPWQVRNEEIRRYEIFALNKTKKLFDVQEQQKYIDRIMMR